MKKVEQKKVNDSVMLAIDEINDSIEKNGLTYYERLRTCNARVYRSGEWTILESYNTMVAAVDGVGRCYDFLRYIYGYTSTSAQHISKFFSDYGGAYYSHNWVSNMQVYRYYPL